MESADKWKLCSWLAKALLALAYAPRWLAATAGSPFSTGLRRQARTFRRLLAALPGM